MLGGLVVGAEFIGWINDSKSTLMPHRITGILWTLWVLLLLRFKL
jgi:hypothetical protein